MKLWEKGEPIDELFERFTIGQDPELDLYLAFYDVRASRAHAQMLAKVGLLSESELESLLEGLDQIARQIEDKLFSIRPGLEDCHSEIEVRLTEIVGEVGKKIHSGRSRNDQVLAAIKLFCKEELLQIAELTKDLFDLLLKNAEENKDILMPGYTHMQVAMPSSFGLWFGAYAESLVDDLLLVRSALEVADKNPLGSAAGYGSSFPLDRQMTTSALGFSSLNVTSIYAQMTRGKTEKVVSIALAGIAATLAKFSQDICTYSGQNFEFFTLDSKFTTGSSIMPHKQNPDGFELVRAHCNRLQAWPVELGFILGNLTTGYHRDLQLLKESLVPNVLKMKEILKIIISMTEGIGVKSDLITDSKYDLLFTVEDVNRLVVKGVPFRDAYRQVASSLKEGEYVPERTIAHSHIGSIGNPGFDLIRQQFQDVWSFFESKKRVEK